jgi:hypothetical protein
MSHWRHALIAVFVALALITVVAWAENALLMPEYIHTSSDDARNLGPAAWAYPFLMLLTGASMLLVAQVAQAARSRITGIMLLVTGAVILAFPAMVAALEGVHLDLGQVDPVASLVLLPLALPLLFPGFVWHSGPLGLGLVVAASTMLTGAWILFSVTVRGVPEVELGLPTTATDEPVPGPTI